MMNDLIEKIAAQTGIPPETVAPVLGAVLAHLGDVLPAPFAHQLAIMLGVHQEEGGAPDADGSSAQPTAGGPLGGFAGSLTGGGGAGESFAGATSLMNVAQSLLGGFLSGKR
jgi:hypothetical protein